MWRLTASLLVLALASASPQFGYLPPSPSDPSCQVAPSTSIVYDTRVQTSVRVQTVNQFNTQYVTTTLVRQQVVPTTLYETQVRRQPQYQTSVIQSTTFAVNNRFVTQTVPSPPIQSVVYITSTRVVPRVDYVTRTQILTQVVPVESLQTQYTTVYQPVTNYETSVRQETRVVSVTGPAVVQTRLQTVVQTSIVRSQAPANTRFITQTQVQTQYQTSVVYGRDQIVTSYAQRQQVIPYTAITTRYENAFATREQVVTRTNVQTQTAVQTQFVPQEVVSTRVVTNTIYSTEVERRVQPFTQVQTVVQTQYNTPAPVIQTREVTTTSIYQAPGRDQVVTREVVQTQTAQDIVYRTVDQTQNIVVTRTVTETCSGYNYDEPAVAFNFGK